MRANFRYRNLKKFLYRCKKGKEYVIRRNIAEVKAPEQPAAIGEAIAKNVVVKSREFYKIWTARGVK